MSRLKGKLHRLFKAYDIGPKQLTDTKPLRWQTVCSAINLVYHQFSKLSNLHYKIFYASQSTAWHHTPIRTKNKFTTHTWLCQIRTSTRI